MENYDIIIVGAGISGAVIAEKYANIGKKVLIIEKRNHIAGNCYDYYNEEGILISKYGAHIFHTNYEDVWQYINRFSDFYHYEHKVLAKINNLLVPIPVNINTINKIFNLTIKNENEMDVWLKKNQVQFSEITNGKEAALSRVGENLYEMLFKHYTKKQWDKYPEEMHASVLNRIPVRNNFDDRYFSDQYQGLPTGGYTQLFKKMLTHANIHIMLNTDYFSIRNDLKNFEKLFYTGPIDQYFDYKCSENKLEYRSIHFMFETHDTPYYQENSVINYPSPNILFTRIIEFKHFTKQIHKKTTICKEYSIDGDGKNEKYYPVPTSKNENIYKKYQEEAHKLKKIFFLGRLANYKYFNMDQAFKNALDLFNVIENMGVSI